MKLPGFNYQGLIRCSAENPHLEYTKAHGTNRGLSSLLQYGLLVVRLVLVLRMPLTTTMFLGSSPRLVVRLFVVAVRLLSIPMWLLIAAVRLLRVSVSLFVVAVLLILLLMLLMLLLLILRAALCAVVVERTRLLRLHLVLGAMIIVVVAHGALRSHVLRTSAIVLRVEAAIGTGGLKMLLLERSRPDVLLVHCMQFF